MDKGFFYVLTNPAQAGLILVDTSSRHPEERLLDDDLSGPGIPVPYQLCYFALLENCTDAMESVHEALEERYVDKRFYEASPDDAVAALEHSGVEILYREASMDSEIISEPGIDDRHNSDQSRDPKPRFSPDAEDTGRLSPGRAGGRYRARIEGPSRRVAPAVYHTSLEERQQRKQAALRRMASNNGIRVTEQNRGVQAPEAQPDTDFEFETGPDDDIATPNESAEAAEAPATPRTASVPADRARREPMLTTVVDNTTATAANDAPLINDAVDDELPDNSDAADADNDTATRPGLRKLFGLGTAVSAETSKVAPQPVRLEPTVPVPAVAAEKRGDTISARNDGSAAKAIDPEIAEIAEQEAASETQVDIEKTPDAKDTQTQARSDKARSDEASKKAKSAQPSRNQRRKQAKKAKQEAAAKKAAQKAQAKQKADTPVPADSLKDKITDTAEDVKPVKAAPASRPAAAKPQADGAMPIPSLDLSAKPKKAVKPSEDGAAQTADLPQPSPQPHGIVYGPQGPIALHPVPGTPYMAMSPIHTAPGGMMPGGPMGNAPMPAPVVHNVGAQPQPAAASTTHPAPRSAAPGPMPSVAPQGPSAAMPDAGNPHHVEAWLNAQDRDSAKRASNRRAILFSLIGIPLGLVTGGGYVVYQGLTDEKTIAIAVGGAVLASIISLYIVGRLTDSPDDTPPTA